MMRLLRWLDHVFAFVVPPGTAHYVIDAEYPVVITSSMEATK